MYIFITIIIKLNSWKLFSITIYIIYKIDEFLYIYIYIYIINMIMKRHLKFMNITIVIKKIIRYI